MGLSKDSEKCIKCPHYDKCDNKLMEACGYLIPKQPLAEDINHPLTNPTMSDMAVKHNYRDVKISENTTITIDIEEMKRKIQEEIYKDLYKGLGCNFQGGLNGG